MVKFFASALLFFLSVLLNGQAVSYSYFYRITFYDKGTNKISDFPPKLLLSDRAIARRIKAGITYPDYRDIPLSTDYLKRVSDKGLTLHTASKWMNAALFKSIQPVSIDSILKLPFVASVKVVKRPGIKSLYQNKLEFDLENFMTDQYDRPVTMINGYSLHNQGYTGQGVLIAVLDGGFDNAEEITSIQDLRARNGIKATYDFVLKNKNVYNSSTHGTAVLSILAGKVPWVIEGTAPDADYLLLKTEDVNSEFPCEEDFWVAGAEYADSAGADIITSSLGYCTFDDPSMNYSFADLNGDKSFITVAADVAASKGILVFNSAGNERNKTWKRIICPADGDSVIAVGAVDGNNLISSFSSAGPSFDRRVKPDIAAMGVAVPLQTSNTSIGTASGTSFSCPVLSGITACLVQAVPKAVNKDVIRVLRESSDRFSSPDSLYGYGIPDMGKALLKLQDMFIRVPDEMSAAGPNPTTGEFEIIFREPYESIIIELFTSTGKLVWKQESDHFAGRSVKIHELENREQGLYIVRITTPGARMTHKIIKLKY
jgi:hypothetical protein